MKEDLFGVIFLICVIQGVVLLITLIFAPILARQTKFFLGFIIFVLVYDSLETFLWTQDIRFITTKIFPYTLLFTLGANFYLIFRGKISSSKTVFFCYLPALCDGTIRFFVFLLQFSGINTDTFHTINTINITSSRLLMLLCFWFFFVLTLKDFKQFNGNFQNQFNLSPKWSKVFLSLIFVIGVVWSFTTCWIIFANSQPNVKSYYLLSGIVTALLYLIGFAAYSFFKGVQPSESEKKESQPYLETLSLQEVADILEALTDAMKTEKIYLDTELSLVKLSSHIGIPARKISIVLNHHLKTGFNEYVNNFRVEEVKRRLLLPEKRKPTILAIAFDSGFNSVPTFQRVFKNTTGLTPKQFLLKNSQKELSNSF